MGLSLSTARQDLLSSLDAYRNALHAGNPADAGSATSSSDAVGSGDPAGAACGVDDADKPTDDVDASQDRQDDDPRNTQATTQSQELQEMLQLMKMFMDALIQQNKRSEQTQPDDTDDGFSPVSSLSGSGGAPGGQAPAQASETPPPVDAGAAQPGVGGGAAPAVGQATAASDPGASAVAPSAPASTEGKPVAGELSTSAQTAALSAEQSAQVGAQWKQNLQKDFGLTNDQAAGIVGNLWHESGGMNSGITQGGKIGEPNANMADDNGNGYGIAQWGGARKQGLIDYAEKNGMAASSQAANYGYLKQELSGPYASAIDAVKGCGDVASATAAFANAFEKPSDPQMDSRVAYAEKVA